MSEGVSVLEFLETVGPILPNVCTVERTTQSKYQFYLVVRHYHRRLKAKPQFVTYEKKEVERIKSTIEEHSVWGDDDILYVLEGFSQRFVDGLILPPHAFVVAETDGGTYKAEPFHYRQRRNILRALMTQLSLSLSLREMLKLDWSVFRSYEEFEPFLRTAKIMGWTEEELGDQLGQISTGNVLSMMKRSQFKDLFAMVERYGATWMQTHLMTVLMELVHYRALRVMGYDETKCARELGLGFMRVKELEETNRMFSMEDVDALVERLLEWDELMIRNRELGISLYLLSNPVRLTR